MKKVKMDSQQMPSDFQKYFCEKVLNVVKLIHQGNNQLYKIHLPSGEYLAKRYSRKHPDNWQRGKAEFGAISYLWEKGFREIPQPLFFDEEDNTGVYSFERGCIIKPENVKEKDIDRCVNFLVKVHNLGNEDKRVFGPASSACLCLQDYVKMNEKRIKWITNFLAEGKRGEIGRNFLETNVYPKMDKLKIKLCDKCNEEDRLKILSLEEQVLTPVDFGFHNILKNDDKYVFLDFEYFGRDDPVRQILEFVHHGKMKNMKQEMRDLFVKKYKSKTNQKDFEKRRILADPFVRMTWALINLHVLSPFYRNHLKFSHGDKGEKYFEDMIDKNLEEAKKILGRL